MKILHSADWHIGNFSGPERDGKNLRSLDTLRCIRHLVSVAAEENPDVVIVAGDLFHDAKVWSARGLTEVQEATKAIKELAERSNVVVLRGTPNHDGKEQFEALKEYFKDDRSVCVATEPTVFKFTEEVYDLGQEEEALNIIVDSIAANKRHCRNWSYGRISKRPYQH